MAAGAAGGEHEPCLTLKVKRTLVSLPSVSDETPIQEILGVLPVQEGRNEMICADVGCGPGDGRRCPILSQRREHCRLLAESLRDMGKVPFIVDGSTRKKERHAILEAIQASGPDEELLVVTTGQFLGEGFDCPQRDTLFLAFPMSSKGNLVQYTGRLMRPFPGKSEVIVYDYADTGVAKLQRMFKRRLTTYRALGFIEGPESA